MEKVVSNLSEIRAALIDHSGSDHTAAYSAWVSTNRGMDRTSDERERLMDKLAREGHLGCFEHQVATMDIVCPIFIARQVMRHRTFSYNELSGRYKDLGEQMCYAFGMVALDDEAKEHLENSWKIYRKLRENGISKEDARVVLPLGTMTNFRMTGNLRNWNHFLKLRLDLHAQMEVRHLASQIDRELTAIWPYSMYVLKKYTRGVV